MTPPHLPRLRRVRLPRLRWPRSRRSACALAIALLVALWWGFGGGERRLWPREQMLDAIRFVESGHRENVPDGDGGKAIGPYQIHRVYWEDAVAFEPLLGSDYQLCRQRAYAERVVDAYMRKWMPQQWASGEAEAIARVHNGGPRGATLAATLGYWQRVRDALP